MRSKKAQVVAITLFAPILMISYTNCSNAFQPVDLAAASASSESGPDETTPLVDTPNPGGTPPPAGVSPTPTPAPTPSAGKKSVLMAIGHMGRTVVSCDAGRNWIRDRSDNDATRCWIQGNPNYVECDHTPFSATPGAAAFADGYFFVSFGWGYNGDVKRSRDGISWEIIKSNDWGGGTLARPGSVFSLRDAWTFSTNQGQTWQNSTLTGFDRYTLDHPMPFQVGQTMFAAGRDTNRTDDIAYSSDGGRTWNLGTGFRGTNRSMVGANGVIVSSGHQDVIGRSTDGGVTWTQVSVPAAQGGWKTNVIHNGTHFLIWTIDRKFMSADGLTWTSTQTNRDWYDAVVLYDPTSNSYVAITQSFGGDYAGQFAYRSTDGNTWTRLSAQAFRGGHPINQIIRGEMNTADCP